MQVRWSPEAADDLAAILNYLQANSSSASQRIADELFSGIAKLEEFPLTR
jgi:plasmid stabilization system protein ParE